MAENPNELIPLLRDSLKAASAERQRQTEAFTTSLSGLRWELRIMAVLAFLLLLARDGVMGKVTLPGGFGVETSQASIPGVGTANAGTHDPEIAPTSAPDVAPQGVAAPNATTPTNAK